MQNNMKHTFFQEEIPFFGIIVFRFHARFFSTSSYFTTPTATQNIDDHLFQSCTCEDDPLNDQLLGIDANNLRARDCMLKEWTCNDPMITKLVGGFIPFEKY